MALLFDRIQMVAIPAETQQAKLLTQPVLKLTQRHYEG